jgi:hypothetical protein
MDKTKLIMALCDIETKAVRWSNKSYECGCMCGSQYTEESTKVMRNADAEFSSAISNLRKLILSEGVE